MARSLVRPTLLTVTVGALVALVAAALASATPFARAQEAPLDPGPDASATVAAVEAEGAAHPLPERVMPYPSYEIPEQLRAEYGLPSPEIVGSPERRCVVVPEVTSDEMRAVDRPKVFRSGEFVIGGYLPMLEAGKRTKLWWRPLADASLEMRLDVRGWRLDAADDTARFRIGPPTATRDSETLEAYADEAFFPGSVLFPSAGDWIVVGRTGRSWGCFLFSVPGR